MSYSISANTALAGSAKGTFLDDLTNPGIGQWPKTQAIKKLTKIVVYAGSIIDSVRVTYQVESSPTPITVQHGGNGGFEALSFEIGADEKVIAIYGSRLVNASHYGDKNIVQLAFVVANSGKLNVPTTTVYTATAAQSNDPTEKFEFSGALVAVTSYTLQPQGLPTGYLQAIGFSGVLEQASPQVI